ncbi:MAG: HNH endonuclease signature motif containing protein [Candidatus Xenobia bacterium]
MIRDAFKCSVPGCMHTLYIEVHHLEEWWRGGKHTMDNLVLLCSAHHRMWHDGLLSARGKPSTGLEWLDARGRPVGVTPPRGLEPEVAKTVGERPRLWGGRLVEVPESAVA